MRTLLRLLVGFTLCVHSVHAFAKVLREYAESTFAPGGGTSERLDDKVDWAEFLSKHDMVWNFTGGGDALPQRWTEEAFFGNGLLGGGLRVINASGVLSVRLHLGRSDIWDKREGKGKLSRGNDFQYDRPRLPLGHFDFELLGRAVLEGSMRVHLHAGLVTGHIRTERGAIDWKAFAHAERPVVVLQLVRSRDEVLTKGWVWRPAISAAPSWTMGFAKGGDGVVNIPKDYNKPKAGEYRPNPPPKQSTATLHAPPGADAAAGAAVSVQLCEQALLAKGGGSYTTAWLSTTLEHAEVGDEHDTSMLVASTSAIGGAAKSTAAAMHAVGSASVLKFEELLESHSAWWRRYFEEDGALVSFPEAWLEGFYYIQMYKLGSAMRPGGPVLDNTGPWLFTPTSWADLHWDLNVQLAYMPTFTSNHPDLALSLMRFMNSSATRAALRANVPPQFRKDSLAAPAAGSSDDALQSCYWSHSKTCLTEPGLHKGAIVGNLLWVCHVLFLYYRYTMDAATLTTTTYPLLHGAVAYYLHLLKPGKSKLLHLPPTASPEYKQNGPDTNYDLGLLRWGLRTLLWISEEHPHGLAPAPLAGRWRDTLTRLAPYPQDPAKGYHIAQGVPLTAGQRHFSHLLMFYPLQVERWENNTAPAQAALQRSVDHWVSLCQPKDAKGVGCAGYSFTGAAFFSLLMGRADAALSNVTALLGAISTTTTGKVGMGSTVGPNTMYGERCKKLWPEPCPCMETPLHAADALQGLLLQSGAGVVDVFPAVPAAWGHAVIHRMRAEGAFLVSGRWRQGAAQWVAVRSLAGAPLTLRPRVSGPLAVRPAAATLRPLPGSPGVFRVEGLAAGETLLVWRQGAEAEPGHLTVRPAPSKAAHRNFWGKH